MTQRTITRRRFLSGAASASAAAIAWSAAQRAVAQDVAVDLPPNPQILEDRESALAILKPSKSQLEHGLELHANSLVFDSYGFAPRAALDGEAFAEAVNAGASDLELEDLREEMTMTRMVVNAAERAEFQQAFDAAGVTCIFQNAGQEGQDPLRLIKRLARFSYVTDMMGEFVSRAPTPAAIDAAKQARRHCLYFSGNGVPLTQQWESVEDELRYVRIFFQLGIRMMHLTYNRRNMIGDGCAEKADAGLSDFGRAVVAELNRVGVIADVAHSGWRTSLEGAQASSMPMVASHTTCTAIHHHVRSKPDEVIRAIVDTGGLIGICCIPAFLGRGGDIAALLDHIDYVAKMFGVDHVAIGTDVAYASRFTADQQKKVPRTGRSREPFRSLWPDDAFEGYPRRAPSLAWTNWPMFTVGLVQRGYKDHEIQKIIGGNVMRVARAVLPQHMQ